MKNREAKIASARAARRARGEPDAVVIVFPAARQRALVEDLAHDCAFGDRPAVKRRWAQTVMTLRKRLAKLGLPEAEAEREVSDFRAEVQREVDRLRADRSEAP